MPVRLAMGAPTVRLGMTIGFPWVSSDGNTHGHMLHPIAERNANHRCTKQAIANVVFKPIGLSRSFNEMTLLHLLATQLLATITMGRANFDNRVAHSFGTIGAVRSQRPAENKKALPAHSLPPVHPGCSNAQPMVSPRQLCAGALPVVRTGSGDTSLFLRIGRKLVAPYSVHSNPTFAFVYAW